MSHQATLHITHHRPSTLPRGCTQPYEGYHSTQALQEHSKQARTEYI